MKITFAESTPDMQYRHSIFFAPVKLCCRDMKTRFHGGDMWISEDRKVYHTADTRNGHHLEECPYCGAAIEIEIVEDQS